MAEEARRSIDEIIGSIRSIMEPGRAVANDDGAGDLTDLPPPSTLAEPVAPRMTIDAAPMPPAALDAADAVRMAQIAETVNRNLADAAPVADAPVSSRAPAHPREPSVATYDDALDDAAIVASFGRRSASPRAGERPAPVNEAVFESMDDERGFHDEYPVRDERPMHDRFAAIGDVVEEAVTARGVVRAANDSAPSPVAPSTHATTMAPHMPANLPAPVQAPRAHAPPPHQPASDPMLDDATLRPIVREWLDDNLPPLVERLVREELQKAIHGGRRGR